MKKLFLLSVLCSFLFSLSEARAYTQTDVSNAQFLSSNGIITTQSSTSGYRLNDTITRAELVGIALKVKGMVLPSYQCKGYYSDVRNNDWICRAAELSADNGLVTRANAKFRPQDNVTRAEALAIIMKAGAISIESFDQLYFNKYIGESDVNWTDANQFGANWQRDVFFSFKKNVNKVIPGQGAGNRSDSGSISYEYRPNSSATRAEVFGFAKNILPLNSFVQISTKYIERDDLNKSERKVWKYGTVTNSEYACTIKFPDNLINLNDEGSFGYPVKPFLGGGKIITFTEISDGMQGGFTTDYILLVAGDIIALESLIGRQKECLSYINVNQNLSYKDVLKVYYHNLNTWYKKAAYDMRTPSATSLETFESWYKNVTRVIFREDTIKNLGDNTYEFLVDMTENGIKSTYKVKSKVNLENFTINNISSIKQ